MSPMSWIAAHPTVETGSAAAPAAEAAPAAPPAPAAAPPPARAPAPGHHHSLLEASQSLLTVIVVALFIMTFTVQPFRIPSRSMEPTLLVGDFLLVDKQIGIEAPPRLFAPNGAIHRGDLVVFHFAVDPSLHLVKRVIGLPGDRVRLHGDRVYINGRALDEPYAVYRPAAPDSYRDDFPYLATAEPGVDAGWWIEMRSLVSSGQLTVPPDRFFVLGDNRNDSEDSRYWGLVPRAAIVGKPMLIYFSLNDSAAPRAQPSAAALADDNGPHSAAPTPSPAGFARWKRAFRIIN
jgi:signal peptidase I